MANFLCYFVGNENIIPFLLGMIASVIVHFFIKLIDLCIRRKFIKNYLKDMIIKDIPNIINSYNDIKEHINIYNQGFIKYETYGDFNTNILNTITPSDYYLMFYKKYIDLNKIISSISHLSKRLPSKMSDDYYTFLNNHLKTIKNENYGHHEKTCEMCIQKRKLINDRIDLAIDECKSLELNIRKIIR